MPAFSRGKKRSIWRKLWLWANLFFVFALLISYLAPIVDPRVFWPVALFGLLYLPLLFVNLIFALTWLFKNPRYSLISLIAILLGWGALSSHIGFGVDLLRVRAPQKDSLSIRVMSYNVRMFRALESENKDPDAHDSVIRIVKEVNPDILCVQEYYTRKKGKNNIDALIRDQLGFEYQYFRPSAKNNFDSYGQAIFSKYPILKSGHLSAFESGVNSILYIDVQVGADTLRVFNTHLRSFAFQKEDYEFIKKTNTTLEEDVQNTKRIGGRIKHAFQVRSDQVQAFKSHLDSLPGPFVIAGDFNDTPLSFAVNHVGKNLKNAFKENGRGLGKTYNGDFPNFQIDYIFTSPDLRVENFRIIPIKLSDHYPLWADIQYLSSQPPSSN